MLWDRTNPERQTKRRRGQLGSVPCLQRDWKISTRRNPNTDGDEAVTPLENLRMKAGDLSGPPPEVKEAVKAAVEFRRLVLTHGLGKHMFAGCVLLSDEEMDVIKKMRGDT